MSVINAMYHPEPQQQRINPISLHSETEYLKGFREGFIAARDLLMPLMREVTPRVPETQRLPQVDTFRYTPVTSIGGVKPGYDQLLNGGH